MTIIGAAMALRRTYTLRQLLFSVSAMDGRRRWLDIDKLGADGRNHFLFITSLIPCSGVRLHLWPEKGKVTSEVPIDKSVVDVTPKMVLIPTGAVSGQTEPGNLSEQAAPSNVLWLGAEGMNGFKFLNISTAVTLMSNKPPTVSTAVG